MKTKISIAALLAVAVLFFAGCQSSAKGAPVHLGDAAETTITLDDAQRIALEDAKIQADDVTNLHVLADEDDGKLQYEVDFRQGDYEYEYEIDAATGKITSRSRDYEAIPPATEPPSTEAAPTEPPATEPAPTQPPATEPAPTEPPATTKPVAAKTISKSDAKKVALKHAKLKESHVTGLRVELDKDDGITHYDVEFRSGDYEYSYEINATSGKIIEWDKDHEPLKPAGATDPTPTEPPVTEPAPTEPPATIKTISKDEAKKIALNHAKLKEADVTALMVKKDTDDGVTHYDVEFHSGDYEYSYEINATSGKIIEWDKDHEPVKVPDTTPPATDPTPTEPPATTKPAVEKTISKNEAKKIALNHAKLKEADVSRLQIELDKDDGITYYDVDFRNGKYEYSYEINAANGKIIEWDKDIDD